MEAVHRLRQRHDSRQAGSRQGIGTVAAGAENRRAVLHDRRLEAGGVVAGLRERGRKGRVRRLAGVVEAEDRNLHVAQRVQAVGGRDVARETAHLVGDRNDDIGGRERVAGGIARNQAEHRVRVSAPQVVIGRDRDSVGVEPAARGVEAHRLRHVGRPRHGVAGEAHVRRRRGPEQVAHVPPEVGFSLRGPVDGAVRIRNGLVGHGERRGIGHEASRRVDELGANVVEGRQQREHRVVHSVGAVHSEVVPADERPARPRRAPKGSRRDSRKSRQEHTTPHGRHPGRKGPRPEDADTPAWTPSARAAYDTPPKASPGGPGASNPH